MIRMFLFILSPLLLLFELEIVELWADSGPIIVEPLVKLMPSVFLLGARLLQVVDNLGRFRGQFEQFGNAEVRPELISNRFACVQARDVRLVCFIHRRCEILPVV